MRRPAQKRIGSSLRCAHQGTVLPKTTIIHADSESSLQMLRTNPEVRTDHAG